MKGLLLAACFAVLAPLGLTAQTFQPSGDAYVVPGDASNFGIAVNITVGSSGSQGLVQFDLSILPATVTASQVRQAILTLYVNKVSLPGSLNVAAANGFWTESGVNGTNAPVPGATVANISVSDASEFVSVDATALVKNWLSTPASNNGFIITANGSASAQFDAKEAANMSHAAILSLTLAGTGPGGPTGASGATGLAGASGAVGATGPTGATGAAGPAGVTGPTGATAAGAQGATGAQGAPGAQGMTGLAGAGGSAGAAGAAGATGSPGASGAQGVNGATGATGPVGSTGAAGTPGLAGAAGPMGPAGAPGTPGATGVTGANGAGYTASSTTSLA